MSLKFKILRLIADESRVVIVGFPYGIFVRFKVKIIRNIYENSTTDHLIHELDEDI
jgi:hypothetical protein